MQTLSVIILYIREAYNIGHIQNDVVCIQSPTAVLALPSNKDT